MAGGRHKCELLAHRLLIRSQTGKQVRGERSTTLLRDGLHVLSTFGRYLLLVKDYMTSDRFKVSTGEKVEWIAELVRVHKIRHVPVVDESNRLVGLVTDRDIRSATGPGRLNPVLKNNRGVTS